MKNSLKLTALLLVITSGLFAGVPSKIVNNDPPSKKSIAFSSLPFEAGVDLKVEKTATGKVIVIIFDEYANVLLKEILSADKYIEKDYILNKLDNGDYTIQVTLNKKTMKKNIRVDDGQCVML